MNLVGGHNDQNTFHEILEELVTNFNKRTWKGTNRARLKYLLRPPNLLLAELLSALWLSSSV